MRLLFLLILFASNSYAAPTCNATYGAVGSTSNCNPSGGYTAYQPSTSGTIDTPVSTIVTPVLSPSIPPAIYTVSTGELYIPKVCIAENNYCYEVSIKLPNPSINWAIYKGLNL